MNVTDHIDPGTWLRLSQAARLAEVSERCVLRRARQGRIRVLELPGGGRCYRRSDVEALEATRRNP